MRRMWAFLLSLAMLLTVAGTGFAAPGTEGVKVQFDEQELQFDANPFIENDRTLVPIRALAERLGFTVDWNEAEQRITLTNDTTTIVLWIGSNKVVVNGVEGTIDVPAKQVSDRTFVPLRFVSEKLGAQVAWDDKNGTAVVTSGKGWLTRLNKQQTTQDMKGTMAFTLKLQTADPTHPDQMVNIEVPITMDIHVYHNDMLMTMKLQLPADLGGTAGPMTVQMAIKDGRLYQQDPIGQQWTQTGLIDLSKGSVDFSTGAGAMGFGELVKLQEDVIRNAVVSVSGTEQVDGVQTTRLDVDLSKMNFNDMVKKVMGALPVPAGQMPDMRFDIEKYTMTYWVNPETQFIHKLALEMQLTMNVTTQGQTASAKMSMKGEMLSRPVSEPIQFPDFSAQAPTVAPEQKQAMQAYMDSLTAKVDFIACTAAAGKADGAWTDKLYTAGHDASVEAGTCFTKVAQELAALQAPTEFAQFHSTVAQALDSAVKAYNLFADAFDLAAKGDAGWQAKKAEADKLNEAAQAGVIKSFTLQSQLKVKYGLK
jgi:hypothetical protein